MMCGWCLSGYTGLIPPSEQDILAVRLFLSESNKNFLRETQGLKEHSMEITCPEGSRDSTGQEVSPNYQKLPLVIKDREPYEKKLDHNDNIIATRRHAGSCDKPFTDGAMQDIDKTACM